MSNLQEKEGKANPANCKYASMSSSIGKLLEVIVNKYLNKHLEKQLLLNSQQQNFIVVY